MYSKAFATIGIIVKSARLKKGLTQKDLTLGLGYTNTQYYSNLERGVSSMSAENLGKICAIMDIPANTIQKLLIDEYAEELALGFKDGESYIAKINDLRKLCDVA
jgi:transcriptional regulator with XRE-family HTH domain